MADDQILDCVVVGAGPAGTTAAIYLGRFRRSCLVIDAGESRLAWIPRTRNHPGFPYGIGGVTLLRRMHHQARRYGAKIAQGLVEQIAVGEGGFRVELLGRSIRARAVLLASGVVDKLPALPRAREAVRCGLLRICPICDGYETIGQRVGVLGDGEHGAREALFLATYADAVSLVHTGEGDALSSGVRSALEQAGVSVIETDLDRLDLDLRAGVATCQAPGGPRRFDTIYAAFGCAPRAGLARGAGAGLDDEGRLYVDRHQQTSVPGLYAAGDLVRGLNQITTAEAEGAIAATHIHNILRGAAT